MIYTLKSKSFNPKFIIFKERMLTNQRYYEEEIATIRGREITDGTNRTGCGGRWQVTTVMILMMEQKEE
jgi:hypothetical protein